MRCRIKVQPQEKSFRLRGQELLLATVRSRNVTLMIVNAVPYRMVYKGGKVPSRAIFSVYSLPPPFFEDLRERYSNVSSYGPLNVPFALMVCITFAFVSQLQFRQGQHFSQRDNIFILIL